MPYKYTLVRHNSCVKNILYTYILSLLRGSPSIVGDILTTSNRFFLGIVSLRFKAYNNNSGLYNFVQPEALLYYDVDMMVGLG